MLETNRQSGTFSKIFAIVYLSPIGRLLLYALGLSILTFLTLIVTGNRFDDFYFIFGLLLLLLVLLNWVSYAIELARHSDENAHDDKNK